jgi:Terminase DNA packaging enzyme
MSKFEKNMDEIFGIESSPEVPKESKTEIVQHKPALPVNIEDDLTDDYQQSRENLQSIIDQGKEAMEDILRIARESEHPRAFEVYGTLLKNMVDANKELLSIQKQMRDMNGKKEVNNTNIDKAIFVGSTSELSKLLKGKE